MPDMVPDAIPPPINNACVPDIFNKLDANAIERTKVINMQLSFRQQLQEKVLLKYKNAAEQGYIRERDKVMMDLKKTCNRLPNYADIPRLETKLKKMRRVKKAKSSTKHDCVFTTEPGDMKLICTEKEEKPFCGTYIRHHLPTKSRFHPNSLSSVKKGTSMPDLRPKPGDMYRRIEPPGQHLTERSLTPKALSLMKSVDDNFISSKSQVIEDDDDETRTV